MPSLKPYVKIQSMHKAILNWVKSSDYDIATAKAMFNSRRYVYVVFLCHLATEKLLKAAFCKISGKIPPKTHDLFLLIKLTKLDLPQNHQLLIAHLNTASIPTRYPEDISKIAKEYNAISAKKYLNQTKSFLKWLKQNQKLTK